MNKGEELDNAARKALLESETTQQIEVYMRSLAKYPLLTKQEEIDITLGLRRAKNEIIKICLEYPVALNEFYALIKDASSFKVKKIFTYQLDETVTKTDIDVWTKELLELILEKIKKKPKSSAKLLDKLVKLQFTLEDLAVIYKPLKDEGDMPDKLITHVKEAREAKNKMINSNLKLVFSRAKRFIGKGLSLEELIQEGNIGLIKAVEKFNPDRSYKFSTFAVWWIEQACSRAIADKAKLIRIPVHMIESINKSRKQYAQMAKDLGRNPTKQEFLDESGMESEKFSKIQEIMVKPVYLSDPITEEGDTLESVIADTKIDSPFKILEKKELNQHVRRLLSKLSPVDEKVIRMRFGIGEKREHTLEELTETFGVTKQALSQREINAIGRMIKIIKVKGGLRNV